MIGRSPASHARLPRLLPATLPAGPEAVATTRELRDSTHSPAGFRGKRTARQMRRFQKPTRATRGCGCIRTSSTKMPPKVGRTPTNCGLSPLKKVSARRIEAITALKILGTEIIPAPTAANINSGGSSAYLFTVGVKGVEQTGFIQPDVGLDLCKRILAYKERRLDRTVMTPKPHNAPRGIIRTTVVWKINHVGALAFADQRQP
jgi:hypothetical protein